MSDVTPPSAMPMSPYGDQYQVVYRDGPRGEKGDQGVAGPTGPTGSTGPKGDPGAGISTLAFLDGGSPNTTFEIADYIDGGVP